MLDAFEVVMPALKHRIRGRVRPVLGARCGVILLDGGVASDGASSSLWDELELYLEAAGFTCLRVPGDQYSGVAQRAREVLAGVSQLHSIGVERIVLVVMSDTHLPDQASAPSDTLVDFLGALAEQSSTMPALIRAVRSLVAGVKVVADSVVGVATLVPTQSAPATQQRRRRRNSLHLVRSDETGEVVRPVAHETADARQTNRRAILLALPNPGDAHYGRQKVELLTRLYGWISTSLDAPAAASHLRALNEDQSEWQRTEHWLEHRWEVILQASLSRTHTERDPMPPDAQTTGRFSIIHSARKAWPSLDNEARLEWLSACAQAFKAHTA